MSALTKQAIFSSFLKFLEEKPFEKITVKDIVDDCKINRKTFYYYFSDIYAMADEMFRTRIDEIRKAYSPEEHTWDDIIMEACDYMHKNKAVTLRVFRSIGFEKMNDIIFETCRECIPEFMKKTAQGLSVKEEDMNLLLDYSSATVSGVVTRWLRDGMKTVPQEMIERFKKIVSGTMRLSLENAAKL